mmetsp:Transcript_2368/g.8428  ORF Transcript_2368/g.8428 Transcript_2368/m.8428 type:complete len:400 (-) Transcript_2368:41-1240(-)
MSTVQTAPTQRQSKCPKKRTAADRGCDAEARGATAKIRRIGMEVERSGDGVWYWEDVENDMEWQEFPLESGRLLELEYKKGQSVVEWVNEKQLYHAYFDCMQQRNVYSNKIRRLRRLTQPGVGIVDFWCDTASYVESVTTVGHATDGPQGTERGVREAEKTMVVSMAPTLAMDRFSVNYPAEWDISPFGEPLNCKLVTLEQSTHCAELERILANLQRTGIARERCIRVERIQNFQLWHRYALAKHLMANKNGGITNEKELYHGSRAVKPERIYDSEEGFDMRFCSSGKWGIGCYFADLSAYSAAFGHRTPEGTIQILIAKVITGHCHAALNGNSSLRLPPAKRGTFATSLIHRARRAVVVDRYDSVVGVSGNSDIYTVYNNSHAYPAYVVTISQTASLA